MVDKHFVLDYDHRAHTMRMLPQSELEDERGGRLTMTWRECSPYLSGGGSKITTFSLRGMIF